MVRQFTCAAAVSRLNPTMRVAVAMLMARRFLGFKSPSPCGRGLGWGIFAFVDLVLEVESKDTHPLAPSAREGEQEAKSSAMEGGQEAKSSAMEGGQEVCKSSMEWKIMSSLQKSTLPSLRAIRFCVFAESNAWQSTSLDLLKTRFALCRYRLPRSRCSLAMTEFLCLVLKVFFVEVEKFSAELLSLSLSLRRF